MAVIVGSNAVADSVLAAAWVRVERLGSCYYDRPVPLRDLASLMGHDPKTHHKHYGSFTRDEGKKDSVRRAVGDLLSPVGAEL